MKPVLDTVVMSNAGARLPQPVGQGRAGDRSRHRRLERLRAARQLRDRGGRARGRRRAVPRLQPRPHVAAVGRHRGHDPRRLPDHRRDPGTGPPRHCGWGTGGFKATPGSGWVFAHTLATGAPHPLNAPFALDRFVTGRLVTSTARPGWPTRSPRGRILSEGVGGKRHRKTRQESDPCGSPDPPNPIAGQACLLDGERRPPSLSAARPPGPPAWRLPPTGAAGGMRSGRICGGPALDQ